MTTLQNDADFEGLLEALKRTRGFDFTGYKRASLQRRVDKRMQMVKVERYTDYIDYLEVHPDEFEQLFNTILINVTSFFRDAGTWEYLSTDLLPGLLEAKGREEPFRVWSAGCASGQEAYTIAMCLSEIVGVEEFAQRAKIFATDLDEEALAYARQASYDARELTAIPPALLARYFEPVNERHVFHRELRRGVIFGRHDLMQDAPISRIDLLVCRNTLIYFNAEAQGRILDSFHFALNNGGCLFLGKAEMLVNRSQLFTPLNAKRRTFVKFVRGFPRERERAANDGEGDGDGQPAAIPPTRQDVHRVRAAFDADPVAHVLLDHEGHVVMANPKARAMFQLAADDVGRPFQDLELSYRPVELRSLIEQAQSLRQPVTLKDVPWPGLAGDGTRFVDVLITALQDGEGDSVGVKISFADVSRYKRLQEELQHSHQELETAYEELQSTNEEKETANEELQSTVEELETTNEELQSTNEELETMNEELQSTNEELQATNEELSQRSDQLNQAAAFLQSIMASLRSALVVVDRDLSIKAWSPQAAELWGLAAAEVVNTNLLGLDIGLPADPVRQLLKSVLAEEPHSAEVVVDAVNRRGKTIHCRLICTPLTGPDHEVRGAIFLMEETTRAS